MQEILPRRPARRRLQVNRLLQEGQHSGMLAAARGQDHLREKERILRVLRLRLLSITVRK